MPETPTIQEAMTRVMQDVREVAKTDRNTQQGFDFRGIDAVVNAVAPSLRKHGVVVVPLLDTIEYLPFQSSKGTAMMCARVVVEFQFIGPGGDNIRVRVPGEAMDAGDKSTAKAMSVAFRTALLQSLALPTDDVDPDAESYNVGEERSAGGSRQATPKPSSSATGESTALSGAQAAADAGRNERVARDAAASPAPVAGDYS